MPERARDLNDFERVLGEQLAEAARRRYSEPRRPKHPRLLVAAAAVIAATALPVALIATSGGNPAGAAPFEFIYDDNSVTVTVAEAVIDADEAVDQLEQLPGVDADIRYAPASPTLVNQLVAIQATPRPLRVDTVAGRIVSFTVPTNYSGDLLLALGRPAEAGERYEAVGPHEECDRFVGADITDVEDDLAALAHRIRWEVLDADGHLLGTDPPSAGVVTDLVPVSDDELIVVISPGGDIFASTC